MVAVNMFRIRLGISGALAYGGIAPVIFFMSVCPSKCLHNQLCSHAADFREIRYVRLLSKFVYKIQILLISDKNVGH